EGRAFNELQDECMNMNSSFACGRNGEQSLLEAVDRGDVGMVEGREESSLALKSREPIRVGAEIWRQQLQRDDWAELCVACAVDLTHSADAEELNDLKGSESTSGLQLDLGLEDVGRSRQHRPIERSNGILLCQKRYHLAAQLEIATRGVPHEHLT